MNCQSPKELNDTHPRPAGRGELVTANVRSYQRPSLARLGYWSELTQGLSPNPSADGGSPFGRALS